MTYCLQDFPDSKETRFFGRPGVNLRRLLKSLFFFKVEIRVVCIHSETMT